MLLASNSQPRQCPPEQALRFGRLRTVGPGGYVVEQPGLLVTHVGGLSGARIGWWRMLAWLKVVGLLGRCR